MVRPGSGARGLCWEVALGYTWRLWRVPTPNLNNSSAFCHVKLVDMVLCSPVVGLRHVHTAHEVCTWPGATTGPRGASQKSLRWQNGNELLRFGVGTRDVVLWPKIGASQHPPKAPLRRQTRLREGPLESPKIARDGVLGMPTQTANTQPAMLTPQHCGRAMLRSRCDTSSCTHT